MCYFPSVFVTSDVHIFSGADLLYQYRIRNHDTDSEDSIFYDWIDVSLENLSCCSLDSLINFAYRYQSFPPAETVNPRFWPSVYVVVLESAATKCSNMYL